MAYIRELTEDKVVAQFFLGTRSDGSQVKRQKTLRRPESMTVNRWIKTGHVVAVDDYEQALMGSGQAKEYKLDEYLALWMEDYAAFNLAPRTMKAYQGQIDKYILPNLGHLLLKDIQPRDIVRMLNKLVHLSDRSIKHPLQVLSSCLGYAVRMGDLESNPCQRVEIPRSRKVKEEKRKYFEKNELSILIAAVDKEPLKYQAAFYLALAGGLRVSEVLNLEYKDIEKDTVTIRDAKTKGSNRTITLDPSTMNILNTQIKTQQYLKGQLGWETNYIFTQQNGRRMARATPTKWLQKVIRQLNKDGHDLPVLGFHALRHTSATIQVSQGVDIKTVSARLGHSDASMTLKVYTHMLKDREQEAAAVLEDYIHKAR